MYAQKQVWENNNLREIMKKWERHEYTKVSLYTNIQKGEIDNENWKIKADNFDASPGNIQKVSYQ